MAHHDVLTNLPNRSLFADTVGRIGGDEFVVLLTDVQDDQGAIEVAEGIGEALRQPLTLDVTRRDRMV
ncbi:diguanylate cyclase [uncultured Thiodictyon sp.]|uniref:diguanylate cyclase domain-containing protein n=1 Tax=uncultured Thiodictyon sp. TaxID=1846217 RepID=UPI0025FF4AE7|nr:diguanylate cyclase [uncultured Thiodictyon sp.]